MVSAAARAPIGVFDSGVGGLSILTEIRSRLPAESLVYVADQAWAPYGNRSLEEVRARSFGVVGHLIDAGVKVVVVACNTASAAALHELRAAMPTVPFVGMEPAVKPAAERSTGGVVGVLATSATFQGELYASVVDRHAGDATVVRRVGEGLVELVERGMLDGPEVEAVVAANLDPLIDAGVDSVVLGCTHYPYLAPVMRRHLGPAVALVDPAPAVARQVARVVAAGDLSAPPGAGATAYLTTADPGRLSAQVRLLVGEPEPDVTRVLVSVGDVTYPGGRRR